METIRLGIKGINRNRNRGEFLDGECQEIINMRFRDGSWRPIPGKELLFNPFADSYTAVYHHSQDNVNNYIGYIQSTGVLNLINTSTGLGTLINTYTAASSVQVQFLKRFMLVIHVSGIDKYLYQNNEYKLVNIAYPPGPGFLLQSDGRQSSSTETASDAEGLLGKWRKHLINASQVWGHLHGGIMYRIAYKLFDGTYVMHTIPRYLEIEDLDGNIHKATGGWYMTLVTAYLYGTIDRTYYQSFENMKDVIASIVIFASKNECLYTIDEYTLTASVLPSVGYQRYEDVFPVNDAFKKMADASGWYKIHEISFTSACDIYAGLTEAIDMKGYYSDYASRETLTVDNFTAHSLQSVTSFVYNDRLILGDVTTIFGPHTQHNLLSDYFNTHTRGEQYVAEEATRESYLLFVLSTESGILYKLQEITGKYLTKDAKLYAAFDHVIGYPDARCIEIKLITEQSSVFYVTKTFTTKKSIHDNFAYYHLPDFSGDRTLFNDELYNYAFIVVEINFTAGNEINLEAFQNKNSYRDTNRVQVSELKNPFYFPAKNSYQVGTGNVIGINSNTEPISQGQFGQYPLFVFTSKGIWMLEQGGGDVVFASLAPVSGDVAKSADQIISIGNGVIFSTDRGLYVVSGKQIVRLSEAIEGHILSDFYLNNHFAYFVDHTSLVDLDNVLSEVDFLQYVASAKVGFDKINNELIVSNNNYDYSYVYNFESNSWFKINRVFSLFINDYPNLLAIDSQGITNISSETGISEVSILIVSQPQSLGLYEVYKKIERTVLRCLVETKIATYVTWGIWSTDDLITYQFITGSQRTGKIQNIMTTRSHGSAKYYVFMIAGQLDTESSISAIDISLSPRLERKLRT